MQEFVIPSTSFTSGTLVAAESYLIDRIKPDVEIISLPEGTVPGGKIKWQIGPLVAKPPKPSRMPRRKPVDVSAPTDLWVVDLRLQSPTNWAHFLNNHLPLLFSLADQAGLEMSKALALLPKATPGYIQKAADLFGLKVLLTDALVTGHGLEFTVDPWIAIRAGRADWVRLPVFQAVLDTLKALPEAGLPKNAFLSRKDTRKLANEAEIEALLNARGFQKLYVETLSPLDQIRLFLQADEIAAIHGAALAPLLFCAPGAGPRRLIEILPCGHMTDVYRVICDLVGTDWIGVRGRLKPEYVRPAYNIGTPFLSHSLDTFEADPVSLTRAFDILDSRQEV